MLLLLQYTLIFAAVLLLVALGGCFSEHSGIINIGLEGIMVMGALGGALVMRFLPYNPALGLGEDIKMFVMVFLGSVTCGVIYSLFLAVPCINFNADQTIVGTAMNLLGTALATVIVKSMNTAINPDDHSSEIAYIEAKKAFHSTFGGFELNWFVVVTAILLVVSIILLYKTRFGLRLRACGEHPQAADSVGINVYKMRYAGVLISGFLGGLGGLVYISAGASIWKFEVGVAGFGFLALAVMIFGAWKPQRIALAALLFGLFRALSNVNQGIPFLANLHISSSVYLMLPYIVSLIILALTSKNSHAPKAEGIPYDKGSR
ncbi:MAG: ABC transporter permease [Faecousia sp.]